MAQHTTLSCSKLQPPPPSMAASLSRRLPGSAQRRLGRPQRCARLVARSSSSGGDRRPAAAAAAAAPAGSGSGGWRTFWAAVDTSAWLGTVGTALAFFVTQEALLVAGPVVLPLLALYAGGQRQRLASAAEAEAQLQRLQALLLELQAQTADEVADEVAAEVGDLLAEQQRRLRAGAGADAGRVLAALEGRLAAMEGSVAGTGSATREALQQSVERQGRLASDVMGRVQDLGTALRRDVAGALQAAGGQEAAALGQVEARLASLEGAIRGLEAAQSDSARRLNTGLEAALGDVQDALEAAVRDEAYRSLDAVRRLPDLLQQAMPITPEVVVTPAALGPERALPSLTEEGLRSLLGEQLAASMRQLVEQQERLLEAVADGQPAVIAPQQWNQLGGRLAYLQELMLLVLSGDATAAAVAASQQQLALGMAAASTDGSSSGVAAAVDAELAGLRAELGALTSVLRSLLDEQQAEPQLAGGDGSGSRSSGSSSSASGAPLPEIMAAVQAVQDQVVLLRLDLVQGDAQYAELTGLQQQLETALLAMQAVVADSAGSGAVAGAGTEVQQQQQQQQVLTAALQSLAGLGERLDGVSRQLERLQVGLAPAGSPLVAGASPGTVTNQAAAEQAPAAAVKGQPKSPGQRAPAAAAAAAAAAAVAADDRQDAYRRMQQLLHGSQAGDDAGSSGSSSGSLGSDSAVAIAEWLSGESEAAAATAATAAAAALSSSAAGLPEGGSSPTAPAIPLAGSNGRAAGDLQQQIEFAAAMGLQQEEQEQQGASGAALEPRDVDVLTPQEAPSPPVQPMAAAAPPVEAAATATTAAAPLEGEAAVLYERGVQRLREGRTLAVTAGANLGLADAALWEASEAFEALLVLQPGNVRALGNYGNALLAHAKLKKAMAEEAAVQAAPTGPQQAAALAAAQQRLAADVQEMLLLAGRKYLAVLEAKPGDAKAYINWGRAVGLRADMARAAGDAAEGASLFLLASDKFSAAIDLQPENAQALRLCGQSLLDAALCWLAASNPQEARLQFLDAAAAFETTLGLNPADGEAAAALEVCRHQLAAMDA